MNRRDRISPLSAGKAPMFAKNPLALATVAATSVSASGAFAQNFGCRGGYRFGRSGDYRDLHRDGGDIRNVRADRRCDFRAMHCGWGISKAEDAGPGKMVSRIALRQTQGVTFSAHPHRRSSRFACSASSPAWLPPRAAFWFFASFAESAASESDSMEPPIDELLKCALV